MRRNENISLGTSCEFYVVQKLLALALVEGHSVIRRRYGQKNAWYFVAEHGTVMRLVPMFFGPHAPDAQTARPSVFSHCFKRLERFQKLATSYIRVDAPEHRRNGQEDLRPVLMGPEEAQEPGPLG